MWPGGGEKIDRCPCCKICENCPGYQKKLDVRDAAFILYRHTAIVEDIDKKTGSVQVISNTLDDVLILENKPDAPLGNVDFTDLERNKISCPRCVNIIRHAQSLLQDEELTASDIAGVCEHCRQRSGTKPSCLQCKEIADKIQSSREVGKGSSRTLKVKTWLAKIQGLIKDALVQDSDRMRGRQISRRHSDDDLKNIIKKPVSKYDHEPEIQDLILENRDLYASKKRPLTDREHYSGKQMDKEVIFNELETSHRDGENDRSRNFGRVSGTSHESNITLSGDEFKKELLRRYEKEYNELKKDALIPPSYPSYEKEENSYNNRGAATKSRETLKEDVFETEDKYFETQKSKNISEADIVHVGKKKNVNDDRLKNLKLDNDSKTDMTQKDQLLDKYHPDVLKKNEYVSDTDNDLRNIKESVSTSDKYYDSDRRKDLVSDVRNRRETVPTAGKDYDSDKKRVIPIHSVSDDRKRTEREPTNIEYHSVEKRKIPTDHAVSENRKRRETGTTDSKFYDSADQKHISTDDIISHDKIKTEKGDMADKRHITTDHIISHDKIKTEKGDSADQRHKSTDHIISHDKIKTEKGDRVDKRHITTDHIISHDKIKTEKGDRADKKHLTTDHIISHDKMKTGKGDRVDKRQISTDHIISHDKIKTEKGDRADKRHITTDHIISSDKIKREKGHSDSKYYDIDEKRVLLKAHKYNDSDMEQFLQKTDLTSNDRTWKSSGLSPDINETDRQKGSPLIDYKRGRKSVVTTGIDNEIERNRITPEKYADHSTTRKYKSPDRKEYGEERHTPASKQYEEEGEQNQGFISRIGQQFEEKLGLESTQNFLARGKDINKFQKVFHPLALRRYTHDISSLFRPIVGIKAKDKNISKKGKKLDETSSHIRRYRSEESLLAGKTMLKGLPGELAGFDFVFPQTEGLTKQKTRIAKRVSSSELIKDTMEMLKLKAEEDKKKREEAERLKEELRKKLEDERRERGLAKKIEKDLEKQLKQRQKEMDHELKARSPSKQMDTVEDTVESHKNFDSTQDKLKKEKDVKTTEIKLKGEKPTEFETQKGKSKKEKVIKTVETPNKGARNTEIESKLSTIKGDKVDKDKTVKGFVEKSKEPFKHKHEVQARNVEQVEREKMLNEVKNQREEERRKKTQDEKLAKEAAVLDNEMKKEDEKSRKKGKTETIKPSKSHITDDVTKPNDDAKQKKESVKNDTVDVKQIKIKKPSIYDLVEKRPKLIKNVIEPSGLTKSPKTQKDRTCSVSEVNLSDLELDRQSLLRRQKELDMQKTLKEVIVGDTIHKVMSYGKKTKAKEENVVDLPLTEKNLKDKINKVEEQMQQVKVETSKMKTERHNGSHPLLINKHYDFDIEHDTDKIELLPNPISVPRPEIVTEPKSVASKGAKDFVDLEYGKGVVRYTLSDRSFIEKGWTVLPTVKVVRKINVYRMRPSHPEFDWFERNKNKGMLEYDTGEKLAQFDDNGRGRLYYKNGNLALDYYNAEEVNAQQRFVVFSSGEPDERGRTQPRTVLATFDYLGNGIVFDHAGKIRLKYNQTEGVILDRSLGPVSHWKWHSLNDPPVLQQVMIDTQMAHKDPDILKLGGPKDNQPRPDDEQMLAIEFDNFIKEKSAKLSQSFKPFQIKMKALKINEYFSLRVLDQSTVYLIYRDGPKIVKLNIGMILDHKEIIDTDTAEMGEVSNNLERLPAATDSLAELQRNVANARKVDRSVCQRERRIRRPEPTASADRLRAAASRALQPPLRTVESSSAVATKYCKCRKPTATNVYYDTSLI